jgi:hypothetical protein
MLRKDFARTTDSIGATDFYKMAMDFHDRQKQKQLDANEIMSGYQKGVNMQRQNALADALQSGDEEAINKAAAAYDPQAAMQERLSRMAEQRKFDQQKELLGIKNNYDAADFDRRAALAKEIAQIKAGGNGLVNINMGANGETPVDTAQMGLDTLQDIADRDSIGAWTRFRKGLKLTSDQEERDLGAISSSIAAIAPEAISKLKAAGVSGINTMAEFLTYLGLPENPTSQEIAGALPQISAIIGKSGATTAQQTPVNYKEKYGLR